ncbi:MAG TPA: antibiotic biosynthesis monooxygenase [Acidimicrobiales bacterium]|nr:antibiotic biosynthesis monooxygenase [Acidimicrobiales bacterium]
MAEVLEVARFKVKPDDEGRMLAARPAMEAALERECPGFVSLVLTRDGDTWVDIVRWESREQALAAMEKVMTVPECQAMFSLIDEVVATEHLDVVRERGRE